MLHFGSKNVSSLLDLRSRSERYICSLIPVPGARPVRGKGGGGGSRSASGLPVPWRGGKSLDWTGEAAGLTGGRAHIPGLT